MTSYRAAYIKIHGDPPDGFHIHHLCGNNGCTNVMHLVAVSRQDHYKIHNRESFCDVPRHTRLRPEEATNWWQDELINPRHG